MEKNSSRLVSLDIFRGLTVAFMIVVNNPGSWNYVYPPLRHSSWHGCTPTDLVFPFFLFIVGVSMWYSLNKYEHELHARSVFRIFRRTVTIFAFGLFLAIFPNFGQDYTTLRIMGVLAIIYLLADVLRFKKWGTFFIVFGTNALFAYFLAAIWTRLLLFIRIPAGDSKINLYTWFYEKACFPVAGHMNGSLMFALIQMLLIWCLALILYRKKILIRL